SRALPALQHRRGRLSGADLAAAVRRAAGTGGTDPGAGDPRISQGFPRQRSARPAGSRLTGPEDGAGDALTSGRLCRRGGKFTFGRNSQADRATRGLVRYARKSGISMKYLSACTLVAVLSLAGAGAALAHADLASANPAAGATIATAPTEVS